MNPRLMLAGALAAVSIGGLALRLWGLDSDPPETRITVRHEIVCTGCGTRSPFSAEQIGQADRGVRGRDYAVDPAGQLLYPCPHCGKFTAHLEVEFETP